MLHFQSKSLRREYTPPSRNPSEEADSVRPFGPSGVGLLTGHPVGLEVVLAIIVIAMVTPPPARVFFGGAILLGGIIGLIFWLNNRNREF